MEAESRASERRRTRVRVMLLFRMTSQFVNTCFNCFFLSYSESEWGAKMSQATSGHQPVALLDILWLENLSLGLYSSYCMR